MRLSSAVRRGFPEYIGSRALQREFPRAAHFIYIYAAAPSEPGYLYLYTGIGVYTYNVRPRALAISGKNSSTFPRASGFRREVGLRRGASFFAGPTMQAAESGKSSGRGLRVAFASVESVGEGIFRRVVGRPGWLVWREVRWDFGEFSGGCRFGG